MEGSNIFSGKAGKGKGKGGGDYDPDDEEPELCTVRGSTDNPTYPWCPDDYGYDECDAIAYGDGPTDGDLAQFRIDFVLEVEGDLVATLERIEQYLQHYLAPALAGCYDENDSSTVIDNVIFTVVEDTESGKLMSAVLFCVDGQDCCDLRYFLLYQSSFLSLLHTRRTLL